MDTEYVRNDLENEKEKERASVPLEKNNPHNNYANNQEQTPKQQSSFTFDSSDGYTLRNAGNANESGTLGVFKHQPSKGKISQALPRNILELADSTKSPDSSPDLSFDLPQDSMETLQIPVGKSLLRGRSSFYPRDSLEIIRQRSNSELSADGKDSRLIRSPKPSTKKPDIPAASRAYHPAQASMAKSLDVSAVGGLKEGLITVIKELPKARLQGLNKAGERVKNLKKKINELQHRRRTLMAKGDTNLFSGSKAAKITRPIKECLDQINNVRANFSEFPGWKTYELAVSIDEDVFGYGIERGLLNGAL